jgi:hypothetical protein
MGTERGAVLTIRRRQPRENVIEQYFLGQCRQHGFLCLKFTSPSRGSVPDRIVVTPAGTVFVELKRPGEGPTKRQLITHAKLRRFGAEVHVVSDKTGVDAFISDMLHRSQAGQHQQRAAS